MSINDIKKFSQIVYDTSHQGYIHMQKSFLEYLKPFSYIKKKTKTHIYIYLYIYISHIGAKLLTPPIFKV